MEFTEVKITKITEQEFLPKPSCRKPRTRHVEHEYTARICTVHEDEFPVAMLVNDWQLVNEEIRVYDGTLYRKSMSSPNVKELSRILSDGGFRTGNNPEYVEGTSVILSTHTQVIEDEIEQGVSGYLICADTGTVWLPTGEPRYVLVTGGFGNNHGFTSLTIDYSCYRGDYPRVFNALQRDEAIAYAKKVALNRGDTKCVEYMGEDVNIEVLIPDAVKFDRIMDSPEPLRNMCQEGLRMYDAIASEKTSFNGILDADTILADILPDVSGETGVGREVLTCWLEARSSLNPPQYGAEQMFEILTGVSFADYIERVYKETRPRL